MLVPSLTIKTSRLDHRNPFRKEGNSTMSLYRVTVKLQVDPKTTFASREYYISISDWQNENFVETGEKEKIVKEKATELWKTELKPLVSLEPVKAIPVNRPRRAIVRESKK